MFDDFSRTQPPKIIKLRQFCHIVQQKLDACRAQHATSSHAQADMHTPVLFRLFLVSLARFLLVIGPVLQDSSRLDAFAETHLHSL